MTRSAEPAPQVGTEHDSYTVRAVIAGTVAEWQLPNWVVAAETGDGRWITWQVVAERGQLLYCCPFRHERAGQDDRTTAWRCLVERVLGDSPVTLTRAELFAAVMHRSGGERSAPDEAGGGIAYDPLPALADLVATARGQSGSGVIVRELIRGLRLPEDAAAGEIERAVREVIGHTSNGPNVGLAEGQRSAGPRTGAGRGGSA